MRRQIRSFSSTASRWTMDVDEGQRKQIVEFELFVGIQHLAKVIERQVGPKTVSAPFACGESPSVISFTNAIRR